MTLDRRIKVKETKKGKVYGFHAYIGIDPVTKKSVTVTRSKFKTGTAAQAELNRLIAEGPQKRFNSHMTVDDLFKEWFKHYKPGVREGTARVTLLRYKSHIKKELGQLRVTALTTAYLQGFLDDLAHLELKMIRRHRALLISMLDYAKALHLIKENPAVGTILPKIKVDLSEENNFYNADELATFLEAAKRQPRYQYLFFMTLAYTGIRKSEALALKWEDVDLDNRIIHVTKSISKALDGSQIITPPKNQKSIRDIPINPILLETLKAEKMMSASEWVFYNYTNDKIFNNLTPKVWLNQIYKKLPEGFHRITVHGFRHTFATLYAENDLEENPKILQTILGHAKITTTLGIYTHVTQRGEQKMRDAIDGLDFTKNNSEEKSSRKSSRKKAEKLKEPEPN